MESTNSNDGKRPGHVICDWVDQNPTRRILVKGYSQGSGIRDGANFDPIEEDSISETCMVQNRTLNIEHYPLFTKPEPNERMLQMRTKERHSHKELTQEREAKTNSSRQHQTYLVPYFPLCMAMCKSDNDFAAMQSQTSLGSLIASVERAAAEVSRVALQHQEAQSLSCDAKSSEKKKVINAVAVPTEDTKASHSIGIKRNSPNEVSHVERHLRSEDNEERHGGEEEEVETTIGARAKKRRRSKRNKAARESEETEKGHKRTVVYHNYHDYATNPVRFSAPLPSPERRGRGGITSPFPTVLHNLLNRAKSDKFEHIVSWQPHGRCFLVHDQERFVKEVMPMFFRQSRFSSFQRQLSLYGFLRLTQKNEDYSAYYHELFLRGMPHLCVYMQRTRVKGYWVRQSSSPDTEPNFYSMPFVNSETENANKTAPTVVPIARNDSPATMPDVPGSSWSILAPAATFSNPLGLPPFFALPPASRSASVSCFPEVRHLSRFPPMPPLQAPAAGPVRLGTGGAGTSDWIVPGLKWNSPASLGMEAIEPLKPNVFDLDAHERHDLVAFLSDVDLDTDNEDQGQDKKVRACRYKEEL